jgi:transcriptional regulator with XRE-family HTH domain
MIFNKEKFANAIRIHRAEKGLSLKQVSIKIGLCTATLYRLSNTLDPGMPDIETFQKLIKWMDATHDEFFITDS